MLLVVDVETSGLRPEAGHAVVELAAVSLHPRTCPSNGIFARNDTWMLGPAPFSTLVAPGRRLSPEAQAVHHLRDADLRTALHLPQAIAALKDHFQIKDIPAPQRFLAAHNAVFDCAFLNGHLPKAKWLCTYRLACHLFPQSPGHSNQVLRYFLNLDDEVRVSLPTQSLAPHRALYDAITTAVLLKHMLSNHMLEDLLILQDQPVLQRTIRFGKYRSQLWSQVPKDYLQYVLRQNGPGGFDPDILYTARYYLETNP